MSSIACWLFGIDFPGAPSMARSCALELRLYPIEQSRVPSERCAVD
jgi:hypothetical protein